MTMPFFLQYLIKLTIGLSLVHLFYRVVLRPLTFYRWNRWYLAVYPALCFIIPLVNVLPWMEKQGPAADRLLGSLPAIADYSYLFKQGEAGYSAQTAGAAGWALVIFLSGACFMLARLLWRYLSLCRLRRRAMPLFEQENIRLYDTGIPSTPFSFGRSIYLDRRQHGPGELDQVIRHELVHVQERHTIDLLLGEFLCVVNWFNPFAWAIRHAIRQNLEFIADRQVLQGGLDKREYQYLLLKVIGINHYSIAHHFNLANLKTRIAMMNKLNSSRVHLAKFLFTLPLLVVVLAAFRENAKASGNEQVNLRPAVVITDTQPRPPAPPPPPPLPPPPPPRALHTPPAPPVVVRDSPPARTGTKADPLYVVDDIEQAAGGDALKKLPPTDIESVKVWKDRSAVERYGRKGRNGVIVVKTRRGQPVPKLVVDTAGRH